ncbi:hypothetical protein DES53_106316 [Roseimicrobium gellanilyticum]|uniref:3-keto-disaccharide hydrolase domain-containing protein n=1 Tax=Roseimicrobium gellanilyticum TaxID=748857 RepID=A0A366HIL4_9BACT|nr:hypothetical protein [Roseimicrobium gellanilyticum]RBP42607.1 hypothetical protein DES53_106316 [Roseimicrobium gellanilyticum]
MKRRIVRAFTCAVLLLAGLSSCGPKEPGTTPEAPLQWELFGKELGGHWKEAEMLHSGGVQQETDGHTLKAGSPMTGIVFPTWEKDGLPLTSYRLTYEAMRVSGKDFFGSVTFPVGAVENCVTFVLGGWGGSQVGISSIDGMDATMNATGSVQRFEDGKWYRIRIEVTPETLSVWLDDRSLAKADISRAQLSLRSGEIDRCVPFGFATYGTEGRIRNCVVERLGK